MRYSDPISQAYEPVAPLLALFGQTPESHAASIRKLDQALVNLFCRRPENCRS